MHTRLQSGISQKKIPFDSTSTPRRRENSSKSTRGKAVARQATSPPRETPIHIEILSPITRETHPIHPAMEGDPPPLQYDNLNAMRNLQQGQNPGRRQDQRAMKESIFPTLEGVQSPILCPPIAANQFDLKSGLLNLVSSSQFSGGSLENPNVHLNNFYQILNIDASYLITFVYYHHFLSHFNPLLFVFRLTCDQT